MEDLYKDENRGEADVDDSSDEVYTISGKETEAVINKAVGIGIGGIGIGTNTSGIGIGQAWYRYRYQLLYSI